MPDGEKDKSLGQTIKEVFTESAVTGLKTAIGIMKPDLGAKMLMSNVGFNEGVRDLVRDVPWAFTWLIVDGAGGKTFWGSNSGDQQYAPHVAQGIEDFWTKYVSRQNDLGESTFRMASGWELPKDATYNGKKVDSLLDADGKKTREISDVSAIFYRDKGGHIDVLTYNNPKYASIVGPYLFAQIGGMVATGGAGTVLKGMPAGARAVTVLSRTALGLEIGDNVSSLGALADGFAQPLIFKPMAIKALGDMFADPNSMDAGRIKSSLNTFMSQYSHQIGTMTEQYYIPSIKDEESPWKRLEAVGTSRIEGYRRNDPFEDIRGWPQKKPYFDVIQNTNVRNGLEEHKEFNKAYYDLAEKAMKGGLGQQPEGMSDQEYSKIRLTDKEVTALRFMLDIKTGADLGMKEVGYTPEERQRTHDVLKYKLGQEMTEGLAKTRLLEKETGLSKALVSPSSDKTLMEQFANYAFQKAPEEEKLADAPKVIEFSDEDRNLFVQAQSAKWQKSIDDANRDQNAQTLSSISRFGYLPQ